jgi:hypothetical protein
MARRATIAAPPSPPQVPVVDAATVASEARRSAAAVRKRKNATDLASTQVHVQRLREENRRPNTRSTYRKCWRLWKVNAGASLDGPPSPSHLPPLFPPLLIEATLTALVQEWCAQRGWEDGELVWEGKAILFLTEVVFSIRQVRPQKLPRAEAGVRKRKMTAARQATRRCRLRQAQAEKDAGAAPPPAEAAEEEEEEEEELEDVEASESDPVEEVVDLGLMTTGLDLLTLL